MYRSLFPPSGSPQMILSVVNLPKSSAFMKVTGTNRYLFLLEKRGSKPTYQTALSPLKANLATKGTGVQFREAIHHTTAQSLLDGLMRGALPILEPQTWMQMCAFCGLLCALPLIQKLLIENQKGSPKKSGNAQLVDTTLPFPLLREIINDYTTALGGMGTLFPTFAESTWLKMAALYGLLYIWVLIQKPLKMLGKKTDSADNKPLKKKNNENPENDKMSVEEN